MRDVYPPGPAQVPPDLVAPSSAYKRHAWLALAGLLLFVGAYLAFGLWLARTALHLFAAVFRDGDFYFVAFVGAVVASLLAVFLFKALFFIKRGTVGVQVEVRKADEPRLFEFLYRLADEARAPRPHRVYLSHEVNAGVYYDLSLLNLLLPSKKNLVIGLGLVNVLSVSEFKAVLAHEFGHFTQRTMAIGRWVYIARQIAAQIVFRRDALDQLLNGISHWDLRIAWVGWLLRLIIWSIRSVADTLFRVVMAAERALSREMERHADLVAVAMAGSDAPVHGLHRLGPADEAMDDAMAFLKSEGNKERAVTDLFAVQSQIIEHTRRVLSDPLYGDVPPLPERPETHRLFRARLAHPPKMWATHPPNDEREELSKARYLPAPLDARSAWILFQDPQTAREHLTANLYIEGKRPATTPMSETLAHLDEHYRHPSQDPRYRGVYLSRSTFGGVATVEGLYQPEPLAPAKVLAELAGLYPAALREPVARLRELREELALLKALEAGALETSGRVIRHRGVEHRRRELPELIARTSGELDQVEAELAAHDRRCRSAHLEAARTLGGDWEPTLRGLAALGHYATHREADLDDAIGALQNVLSVVLADGSVSSSERERTLTAASDLYFTLANIHEQAEHVELGAAVAARLSTESWVDMLGPLELPPPVAESLGDWLEVIDSWAGSASRALAKLRLAALAELLSVENMLLASLMVEGHPVPPAPEVTPAVNTEYRPFLPTNKRARQTRLGWWDRFMVADGWVPSTMRLAVAGAIVGFVLWTGIQLDRGPRAASANPMMSAGRSKVTVYVYNGLDRAVRAQVDDMPIELGPGEWQYTKVLLRSTVRIAAATSDGTPIEELYGELTPGAPHLYNVAGAAPLWSWHVSGGNIVRNGVRISRWLPLEYELRFPPRTDLLPSDDSEHQLLGPAPLLQAPWLLRSVTHASKSETTLPHARWDRDDSPTLAVWLRLAIETAPARARPLLQERLARRPQDLPLRELELELELTRDRRAACASAVARAKNTGNADDLFLAAKCEEDSARMLAQATRHPEHVHWNRLAGTVHARQGRWSAALPLLERAFRAAPDEESASELARVRRAAASAPEDVELQDLLVHSRRLRLLLNRSADGDVPPIIDQAAALRAGDLATAATQAEGNLEIFPLVAASDGAPAEVTTRALAEPPGDRSDRALATLLALAVRAKRDVTPYLGPLVATLGEHPGASRFFTELSKRRVPAAALLDGAQPSVRGLAYTAAVIALGAKCPAAWRAQAKALLFVGERPYLQ